MKKHKILMIDDDPFFLKSYKIALQETYEIITAQESAKGINILERERPSLLLLDVSMKTEREGLQVLPFIKEKYPLMPVVIVTNHDSHTIYREALNAGADDFFVKSDDLKTLRIVLRNIFVKQKIEKVEDIAFIAESPQMKNTLKIARKAAAAVSPVIISGETGTGKEVIARFIHHNSPRAAKPMIALNCGALTETMVEDEFFGHEKGAFTNAINSKAGAFERADTGTLFLDELDDLSAKAQSSLLRVLQEKEVQRIGGSNVISVDVRVIGALKTHLQQAVKDGKFREDLYYRLSVFEIHLEPLKKRQADIFPLFNYFLRKEQKENIKVNQDALLMLQSYPWPGNVRELENAVKRACAMVDGNILRKRDFSFLLENDKKSIAPYDVAKQEAMNSFRRTYIKEAMIRNKGNQSATSKETGLSRQALQKILKDLKINGNTAL